MKTKLLTLCYLQHADQLLLGLKLRGFGAGRWNGFGGKVEAPDTSLEAAAERELREECGARVQLKPADKLGVLTFTFVGNDTALEVHIYRTAEFSGEIRETGEMRPKWFTVTELPYDEMWESDRLWLALLLAGKRFIGQVHFDEADHVLDYTLEEKN